jgi:hypothetical protein
MFRAKCDIAVLETEFEIHQSDKLSSQDHFKNLSSRASAGSDGGHEGSRIQHDSHGSDDITSDIK